MNSQAHKMSSITKAAKSHFRTHYKKSSHPLVDSRWDTAGVNSVRSIKDYDYVPRWDTAGVNYTRSE